MEIQELTKKIERLNPGTDVRFNANTYPAVIIARCSDCAQLNLPEGYYFSDKNGLTNKHNTTSGTYESFQLMTEYEYLRELC